MVAPRYEAELEAAGFGMAAAPLREWFARERIDNPQVQLDLAFTVLRRTLEALTVLSRPRRLH